MLENSSKHFYSIDEITELCGIGRTTVYVEINKGNLETVKIGQRRLIPASALDAWEKKLRKASRIPHVQA